MSFFIMRVIRFVFLVFFIAQRRRRSPKTSLPSKAMLPIRTFSASSISKTMRRSVGETVSMRQRASANR